MKKLLSILMLLVAIVMGAKATETTLPTSGSFSNGAKKYELTNASTVVANNKIWWAARGTISVSNDYGMRPYQHAFALEVTGAATLTFNVKSNSTTARTIQGQVYTAIEPFFNVWKNTTVGSSLEDYVITVNNKAETDRTAEESAIHANTVLAGITSQKDANKKTLLCESAQESIATAYGSAISHACPTTKGETSSFDISLEAGKYVIYLTSTGGSVGLTSIDINTAAPSGPVDPTFTLSSEEVEVGSTISVNGPAGLDFTATPVSETEGAVSVDGGTITGVTAGAAQVRVTSAATSEYNAYDHTFDITVTAPVCATPVISPATFTADNQEVTITSETAGATIYYTTDGTDPTESSNEYDPESKPTVSSTTTFKAIAIKAGADNSEIATQKVARMKSAVVGNWNFTNWSSATQAGVRADGTNWRDYESSGDAKPLDDKVYSNKVANATFVYSETTIPETKGLSFATTAYTFGLAFDQASTTLGTYHGSEYLWLYGSNSTITIPSLSAGSTIEIGFESHKTSEERTLTITNINESNPKTKTYVEQTFTVTADGNVTITPSKGMHIYYITVTSNVETEGITTDNGVATYVTKNALDFTGLETKAYVVKSVDTKKNKVFTEEVTTVPAGTALLVKGATVNVPVIASATAPATNLLQISTGDGVQGGDNIFAYSKSAKQFKKVSSSIKVPAGKCYLQIDGISGSSLDIDLDGEATAINNVGANENANSAAPVKVIKNGKLYIGNYNVAGQQVK